MYFGINSLHIKGNKLYKIFQDYFPSAYYKRHFCGLLRESGTQNTYTWDMRLLNDDTHSQVAHLMPCHQALSKHPISWLIHNLLCSTWWFRVFEKSATCLGQLNGKGIKLPCAWERLLVHLIKTLTQDNICTNATELRPRIELIQGCTSVCCFQEGQHRCGARDESRLLRKHADILSHDSHFRLDMQPIWANFLKWPHRTSALLHSDLFLLDFSVL